MDIVSEIRSSMLDELDFKKDLNKHSKHEQNNKSMNRRAKTFLNQFMILFDSVLDLQLIPLPFQQLKELDNVETFRRFLRQNGLELLP